MILKKENIAQIIFRDLGWVPKFNSKLFIVDENYVHINKTTVTNTIKHDEWLKRNVSYKPDVFDCDDYVMYLKCKLAKMGVNTNQNYPAALGFIITNRHAFNFSIDSNRKIILYDTVHSKLEKDPSSFKEFLNFKRGNTIKIIYI